MSSIKIRMKAACASSVIWKIRGVVLLLTLLFILPCQGQTIVAWGAYTDQLRDIPPGIANPIAISAGAFHNLALQSNGTVVAWGNNSVGETNVPASVTNIVAIAAGGHHSLALKIDGTVIAWGGNIDGQTNVPPSATNVIAIAAGSAHSVVLRADGTVVAWGNNDYGQTDIPSYLSNVIAIAAGYDHVLALRSDHSVTLWGSEYLSPSSATNVVAVAAGWKHSLILQVNGNIIAWGDNSYGQSSIPAAVTNAIAIAAGYGHSLAVLNDGSVAAWGLNYADITNTPPGLNNVGAIGCGENHQIAMTNTGPPRFVSTSSSVNAHVGGEVYLCLGVDGTYPMTYQWYQDSVAIAGLTNRWLHLSDVQVTNSGIYTLIASNVSGQVTSDPVDVAVSETPYFTAADPVQQNYLVGSSLCLSANGTGKQPLSYQSQLNGSDLVDNGRISGAQQASVCFDPLVYGDSGILNMVITNDAGSFTGLLANMAITPVIGWGDDSIEQLAIPVSATNVIAVCGGGDHNLALRADGAVVAWGDNTYGQNNVPPSASGVVAIAEGETHSLALKLDGSVIAWGDNSSGQTNVPVTAQGVVAIAAGAGFSQALLANGSIVAWGVGSNEVPETATNVLAISARNNYRLALRADGVVIGWGGYSVPSVPSSITNVLAIAAGAYHGVALKNDGDVVSWGDNLLGQTITPPQATNVIAIAAGDDHSLALRSDGSLISWGDTSLNQCLVPSAATGVAGIGAGGAHSLAVIGHAFARTVHAGESAMLTSGSLGKAMATYQWQFNGTNISGATNIALVFGSVSWVDSGIYQVIISNALGAVTGPPITLAVQTPFQFDRSACGYSAGAGGARMRLIGSSGVNQVVIYASTNLLDWQPIHTNAPSVGPIDFTDPQSLVLPHRFYRAVEVAGAIPSVAPWFSSAALVGGRMQMVLNAQAGFLYSIQFSSNLVHWATLTNLAFNTTAMTITDPAAISNPARFYRAVTPPPP